MIYIMHVLQKRKTEGGMLPRLEFAVTNQETVLEFARMFERTREIEAYWVHSASIGCVEPFHLGYGGNQWRKWQTK